ncbi:MULTISPECIES: hypothetical protein [Myroides]|uniref:Phenylalanyl-tRNA synthetase subunit alpha n=1 Tax=Myroides albus TaxID=2562892 RepID=A0A6I3LHG9_9FLAO|nr:MULTISPECIES: hypothetical protein [Myroides]MTG96590.1 hypothetical protein [Myroides albus]MVX34586.1 hypothetical protein [Myroides sp. LoEW2-1]UVD80997.1 hypothetical protein NWE55_07050 [Myroides albus]
MKKDIEIPEVKNVEIAIVKEYNDNFLADCWYVYLYNNTAEDIEAIMIVSQAQGELNGEKRASSLFRHAFQKLGPKQALKVELLDENIFQLDNTFMLTFFQGGKLYDKNYTLQANTIEGIELKKLPFDNKNGVFL